MLENIGTTFIRIVLNLWINLGEILYLYNTASSHWWPYSFLIFFLSIFWCFNIILQCFLHKGLILSLLDLFFHIYSLKFQVKHHSYFSFKVIMQRNWNVTKEMPFKKKNKSNLLLLLLMSWCLKWCFFYSVLREKLIMTPHMSGFCLLCLSEEFTYVQIWNSIAPLVH